MVTAIEAAVAHDHGLKSTSVTADGILSELALATGNYCVNCYCADGRMHVEPQTIVTQYHNITIFMATLCKRVRSARGGHE